MLIYSKNIRLYFFLQIVFDFNDRFPDASTNNFIETWDEFSVAFQNVLKSQYKSCDFYSYWREDIEKIFIPLKLFPLMAVGRNVTAKRDTFTEAIDKFIVFRNVIFSLNIQFYLIYFQRICLLQLNTPIDELFEPKNKCPYIVAVGEDTRYISKFYIIVRTHTICVSLCYYFLEISNNF